MCNGEVGNFGYKFVY